MTISKYSVILSICTAICWLTWILVLSIIDPFESGWLGLLFFYLSFAFAFLGTVMLVGFLIRTKLFKRDEVPQKSLNIAFRQALLFTFIAVVALMLQSQRYLTWWLLMIVVVFTGFIELFFISYKKQG